MVSSWGLMMSWSESLGAGGINRLEKAKSNTEELQARGVQSSCGSSLVDHRDETHPTRGFQRAAEEKARYKMTWMCSVLDVMEVR